MILYKTKALLQWDLGYGAHFNLHLQAGGMYLALLQFRAVNELSEDTPSSWVSFLKCLSFLPCLLALHI